MTLSDVIQIGLFLLVLVGFTPVLGTYLAVVLDKDWHFMTPILGKLEQGIYRLCGIDPNFQQSWKRYAVCLLGIGKPTPVKHNEHDDPNGRIKLIDVPLISIHWVG